MIIYESDKYKRFIESSSKEVLSLHLFLYTQEDYDQEIDLLQINSMKCPNKKCGSCGLVNHAYYVRSMRFDAKVIKLKVLRIRCYACGHSHALLPTFIVPYSQIPLFDQCHIISLFLQFKLNDFDSLINSQLDCFDIKRVIHNFNQCWKERLVIMKKSIHDSLTPITNTYFDCQFMQIHCSHFYNFVASP